jgi:hypothetical protein
MRHRSWDLRRQVAVPGGQKNALNRASLLAHGTLPLSVTGRAISLPGSRCT